MLALQHFFYFFRLLFAFEDLVGVDRSVRDFSHSLGQLKLVSFLFLHGLVETDLHVALYMMLHLWILGVIRRVQSRICELLGSQLLQLDVFNSFLLLLVTLDGRDGLFIAIQLEL